MFDSAVMLQEIFHLGERVRCLVMGMDDNFTRISLSTAELEQQNGDMLFDKVLHPHQLSLCLASLSSPKTVQYRLEIHLSILFRRQAVCSCFHWNDVVKGSILFAMPLLSMLAAQ